MKKILFVIMALLTATFITGCGPTEAERQAAKKARLDSIHTADSIKKVNEFKAYIKSLDEDSIEKYVCVVDTDFELISETPTDYEDGDPLCYRYVANFSVKIKNGFDFDIKGTDYMCVCKMYGGGMYGDGYWSDHMLNGTKKLQGIDIHAHETITLSYKYTYYIDCIEGAGSCSDMSPTLKFDLDKLKSHLANRKGTRKI